MNATADRTSRAVGEPGRRGHADRNLRGLAVRTARRALMRALSQRPIAVLVARSRSHEPASARSAAT